MKPLFLRHSREEMLCRLDISEAFSLPSGSVNGKEKLGGNLAPHQHGCKYTIFLSLIQLVIFPHSCIA
jgi:hypothetical protein